MTDVTGAKLITQASVFGGAAVVFSIVPFAFVIVTGIMKSEQHTSGGSTILGVIIKALVVHIVSCVAFIASVYALDQLNPNQSGYFSQKVFQVFWNGGNQGAVMGLVGGGNSSEAMGSYVILHLVYVVTEFAHALSPLITFILAIAYGVMLAKKDSYKESYAELASWCIISTICCAVLYIAWAHIASPALFLPEGNLFDRIANFYREVLANAIQQQQ